MSITCYAEIPGGSKCAWRARKTGLIVADFGDEGILEAAAEDGLQGVGSRKVGGVGPPRHIDITGRIDRRGPGGNL